MKINLITVCVDKYPTVYARKLITQFKQVSKLEIDAYCITDRPEELNDICTTIEAPFKTKGWWYKMFMYGDSMPEGWNLYMDLDIVIVENFDEEIKWAIDQNKPIACVSDAIGWLDNKYSSSLVITKSGQNQWIYDIWEKVHKRTTSYRGGDQVYTGRLLKREGIEPVYIDETFPLLKRNLKFHLATNWDRKFGILDLPSELPEGVKLVDCGGQPKPDRLSYLSYIRENWTDI
jgi:hypothetical protein